MKSITRNIAIALVASLCLSAPSFAQDAAAMKKTSSSSQENAAAQKEKEAAAQKEKDAAAQKQKEADAQKQKEADAAKQKAAAIKKSSASKFVAAPVSNTSDNSDIYQTSDNSGRYQTTGYENQTTIYRTNFNCSSNGRSVATSCCYAQAPSGSRTRIACPN